MEKTKPPSIEPHPIDSRKILEDMLGRCHTAVGECFSLDPDIHPIETQIAAYKIAQALMATGVKLATALERRPAQSTHRIIVERIGPAEPAPVPRAQNGKTIKRGGILKDLPDIE